jgi:hypothetical protein
MFNKFGEQVAITQSDIQTSSSIEAYLSDAQINDRFGKFASALKRVAPKSNEFLYFVTTMITSAEAALLNEDGTVKIGRDGKPVEAHWEPVAGDGVKWVCSDPSILPYRNNNFDIFPEKEIIAAHKKWIAKPVLTNHDSSVDSIRGIILDTYYDHKFKRAMALCAIDKISYPELARKIATGVSIDMSMGTAVNRVSCAESNCNRVARTANEFCHHMKNKGSSYGEINLGLDPLEISCVQRGADPRAKIRTVFAAAQQLHSQLDNASIELSKTTNITRLAELEHDLKQIASKFLELKESMETSDSTDSNNTSDTAPYGIAGDANPPQDELDPNTTQLNLPDRLAYNNQALVQELKALRASFEDKLSGIEKTLQSKNEEMNMATDKNNTKTAYWLGTEEPTPGKRQYPVDPLNEQLRAKEDKQMVGQNPFPDVGDVDGLHPSPASVAEKDELKRKELIQRAEVEERAMRRNAALKQAKDVLEQKKAYWLGGGEGNEPTPGKKQYPVDPLNEKARMEDRQMVGQNPFPDVGDVDGLHPSPASVAEKDELKRKEMLNRASLKARFVRTANTDGTENLGASGWHVYAKDESGDRLVFTASVDELSGNRALALYDVIATKDFGQKMLEKIRSVGLSKAASLYKQSQAVAGPGALPGAPPDASGANPVPAMPEAGAPADASAEAPVEDEGGKGDPKETANKLAEKNRDVASDLLEAVRALTGEQSQMGEMEEGLGSLPKAASATLLPLHKTRVELNQALLSGMKKSLAELNEHREELGLITQILDSGSVADKDYTATVVEDAFTDAKSAIADGFALMRAYIKYARGTAGLLKRAEQAKEDMEASSDMNDAADTDAETESDSNDAEDTNDHFGMEDDETDIAPDAEHEHDGHDPLAMHEHEEMEMPHDEHNEFETPEGEDMSATPDFGDEADVNDVMVDVDPATLPAGQKLKVAPASASFDLTTKAGRSAYRAKIANDATGKMDDGKLETAESIKMAPVVEDADKLADGGFLQTTLDTKPSDDLGRFETLPEQQKRMLEVARMPPKIRTAAERLDTLITQGKVAVADLDSLVAQGLDSEVVKYWRQYWGEAGKEGSEFGKLLTTETMKAKAAEENKLFRTKLARAYELSYDMVRRGMLADDRATIASHVDDVMKWNDEGFESVKRIVANRAPLALTKQASMPQVGLIGAGDVQSQARELDFQGELDRAFANRKY